MRVLSLDLDFITDPYASFIRKVNDNKYYEFPNILWEEIKKEYGEIFKDFKVDFNNLFFFFEFPLNLYSCRLNFLTYWQQLHML